MQIAVMNPHAGDGSHPATAYWRRLQLALSRLGVAVGVGSSLPSDTRLALVDAKDASRVPAGVAGLAVLHNCHAESDGRHGRPHGKLAEAQAGASARPRTMWVAASAWAGCHFAEHTGVRADRFILAGVDTDTYFPAERQCARQAKVPRVLCWDRHRRMAAQVAAELRGAATVEAVSTASPPVLRSGDMWLDLDPVQRWGQALPAAMSTGLIVVTPDVGLAWPWREMGTPVEGVNAVWHAPAGALVYDWRLCDDTEGVAACVRAAWAERATANGRDYARRWYNLAVFGQKWLEAVDAGARRFGLDLDAGGAAKAKSVAVGATGHPWENER